MLQENAQLRAELGAIAARKFELEAEVSEIPARINEMRRKRDEIRTEFREYFLRPTFASNAVTRGE